jgi:mycothiol synthase
VLTVAGLDHLASVGVSEVLLYVESDNEPAVRLYGGLGFTHAAADTHVQYRRSQVVGLPVEEASGR